MLPVLGMAPRVDSTGSNVGGLLLFLGTSCLLLSVLVASLPFRGGGRQPMTGHEASGASLHVVGSGGVLHVTIAFVTEGTAYGDDVCLPRPQVQQ